MQKDWKQRLRVIFALCFVCLACVLTVSAAYGTGTVKEGPLNLRAGPGADQSVLKSLPAGASVDMLSAAENGWYKVSHEGTGGYVSADYLTVQWAEQEAIVQADKLNMRAGAGTSYSVLGSATRDMTVIVIGAPENGWFKVRLNGVEGYMSAEYLLIGAAEQSVSQPEYGTVNTSSLNMRSGPGTGYDRVAVIPGGTSVQLLELKDGWYKISFNGQEGYASAEYIAVGGAGSSATGTAADIIATAKGFLGAKYVYGASGPNGFDCSGFTNYVYKQHGYSLNRGASSQLNNGTAVDYAGLQPGDLVFFRAKGSSYAATHVGIFLGDGQFIHASSTGRGVIISDLSSGYYRSVFTTGRHII